jgi:uncharacterized membrane protein HdeD (DUF308 family)
LCRLSQAPIRWQYRFLPAALSGQSARYAQLTGRWGWMLASDIVDLILAGIVFAGLPETATWVLGLLVGINLLFGGIAMIGMALAARSTV